MSLWSTLGDVFEVATEWLGGDSSSFIGDALTAGVSYLASDRQADANREAADRIAAAEQARAEAIAAGNAQAAQYYQTLIDQAAPANTQLQRIVGLDPSVLTPNQQQQLEDVRRNTNAQLAASGLRGAGRTVTAALRNVEGDFLSNAYDTNVRRSDEAARLLSGQGAAAAPGAAGLTAGTGRAQGEAITTGALNQAQAAIVNENLRGQAIGDITSVIEGVLKEKGRESRFKTQKPSEEEDKTQTL